MREGSPTTTPSSVAQTSASNISLLSPVRTTSSTSASGRVSSDRACVTADVIEASFTGAHVGGGRCASRYERQRVSQRSVETSKPRPSVTLSSQTSGQGRISKHDASPGPSAAHW